MVAYVFFMLANAMLFIRPGELMPALGDIQIYLACIAGALLFAIPDLHNQLRVKTLLQQPVNLCVLGVTLMTFISRVSVGEFKDIEVGFIAMVKVLLYYLLLVSLINSPVRLRQFLMTTTICATIMVAYSVVDYRAFNAQWLNTPEFYEALEKERNLDPSERTILRHIPDRDGVDIYGNEVWFFRLCGLGIFHDPNDVSLLLVATSIISIYFFFDPKLVLSRFLFLIPLAINGIAMYYTYSRGGLLAAGVAFVAWLIIRYGKYVAITFAVMGAGLVPIALGRMGNIDLSSGTGQQRIQVWSDGLMAIRNSRVLLGVGEGRYTEISSHVAHNSYVHAFVELGFVGGTLFFGCFFFPMFTFFMMKYKNFRIEHPELRRFFPYMVAIMAGWCMGMCSLSRNYVPPTYMIAGLGAIFVNQVGFYRHKPKPLLVLNYRTLQPWVACSAMLLLGAYVFVKVFARFG